MVSHIRMKQEVIQHELGHWITARHHEIHTDHVEISRDGNSYHGHCNLFIFPRFYDIEDAKKMIEARIRILMAGAAAQLIERQSANFGCVMDIFHTNGKDDYAKISEYISLVSGFSSSTFMDKSNTSDIYNDLFGNYWSETTRIIEDNEENLKSLRDYIISRLDNDRDSFNFSSEELLSKIQTIQA